MSILIKGMEMPESCWRCCLSQLYEKPRAMLVCEITHEEVLRNKIDGNCPLVPVPPHGRLIDADKIRYHSGTWEKGFDWVMQSEIALMPTVIPADKDGET